MIECQCDATEGIHTIIYEPGNCEAVVKCRVCGRLWYTILFERVDHTLGVDHLEEYQIPISTEEYHVIRKTPYSSLDLRFLKGRKSRLIHESGTVGVDAEFALGRCGRLA